MYEQELDTSPKDLRRSCRTTDVEDRVAWFWTLLRQLLLWAVPKAKWYWIQKIIATKRRFNVVCVALDYCRWLPKQRERIPVNRPPRLRYLVLYTNRSECPRRRIWTLSWWAKFVWKSCRRVLGYILTNDSLCSSCRFAPVAVINPYLTSNPWAEANGAKH